MGFRKENATVNGVVIPEAYAVVREMSVKPKYIIAKIGIFTSREEALDIEKTPFHTVTVSCANDRTKSAYELVYVEAKKVIKSLDPVQGKIVESKAFFADWQDDIVEG